MASANRLKVLAGQINTNSIHVTEKPYDNKERDYVIVSVIGKNTNICLIRLNRPKALNALCDALLRELMTLLGEIETDDQISCVILTGTSKAFSAGADIKQMSGFSGFGELYKSSWPSFWDRVADFKKPIIAAVNGYCFGGGLEIAMMCDIIYAGQTAQFGQPEINIGTIPGAGGTQRLPRAIGKSKAMEIILSGQPITCEEALRLGLISGIYPPDQLIAETLKKVEPIAAHSQITLIMAKEAVKCAYEMSLQEGLHLEKRISNAAFATNDRLEGMLAFIEKRKPNFTHT